MKNKFLSILSLALLLTVSGCDNGNNNSNSSTGGQTSSRSEVVSNSSSVDSSTSNESTNSNLIKYTIQVYLSETENVGEGVMVQLCKSGDDGMCTTATTNALGQAIFSLEPAEYKIDKINKDGYTFDLGLKVDAANPNKTVVLEKISDLTDGDGSESNPFLVSEGYYNVTVASTGDIVFYNLTFTKSGKHVLQSLNRNLLTDPKIACVDELLNAEETDYLKNEVQYGNFTIEINVDETQVNSTFTLGFTVEGNVSKAKVYPISIKAVA